MRRSIIVIPLFAACGLWMHLSACVGDDTGASPKDASSGVDGSLADAGGDAPAPTVTVIARFDMSKGQLPEGLWEVSPDALEFAGTTGTPITAWAPAAAPVTIGADGGIASFGGLAPGAPQSTYTLGVITDATGIVYYAVAAAAMPPNDPAPGIYRFPKGGGATATVFSLGSNANPPMNFANGLDFIGSDLYVADSEGVIYKIDPGGVATVWSQDPLLAPSMSACGGRVPLPIGANGIVHDANNIYVTNTDYGRLLKIPVDANGSAGAPTVLKEDCATLVGADGLLIDPKDGSFIVALNVLDEIVRVAPDGSSVTVLASGSPLANPASPLLDTAGGQRRLLVTSPAFFTSPDAGSPNLAQLPMP
jgi:sugar lactone lactonase YvrE